MDAAYLELLLNGVTAVAVIFGVIFGLAQFQQSLRMRRDHAAFDVVRTVQTQKVRQAISLVLSLPDDADPEMIRGDRELLEAALAVDSACEMWGCMVYEGIADHHMIDRMIGGWVRGSWRRLRRWVEAEREANRNVNIGEWWQWLYELLESDPDPRKAQGAHLGYRGMRAGKRA